MAEAKQPKKLNFKLLRDALADPGEFLFSDFSKLERSATLHVAFQALEAFRVSRVKLCEGCSHCMQSTYVQWAALAARAVCI